MRSLHVIMLTFAGSVDADLGLGCSFAHTLVTEKCNKINGKVQRGSLYSLLSYTSAIFCTIKLEQNAYMIHKSLFKDIYIFFKKGKKGGRYSSHMKNKVHSLVLKPEMVLNFCLFPKAETTLKGPNLVPWRIKAVQNKYA